MPADRMTDADWTDMPDVWGEGQLLAFSGLDGASSSLTPFVLHTAAAPFSFKVLLPGHCDITFAGPEPDRFLCVLGDAVLARGGGAVYAAAFADNDTLVGCCPAGAVMQIGAFKPGADAVPVCEGIGQELFAAQAQGQWMLHAARPGRHVQRVWEKVRQIELGRLIRERSAFVRGARAPHGLAGGRLRLFRKAVSVMKVNTHSPCGIIHRHWSTPDRWPHKDMWLWDSAFHAVGMVRVNPAAAQDVLLAMLEQTAEGGMLSHQVRADGYRSAITQPPVLAWAALEVLDRGGELGWAVECIPYLKRCLDWMRANRDRNGNTVPEWTIEGEPRCRCGESGLDNSSVYDGAVLLDAPDFGAFLANDYACLAELARRTGRQETAREAEQHARAIGAAVNELLWCEEQGMYFHRDFNGRFVPVKAVSGLIPLFAGLPTPEQAARLRDHIRNPATFGAPLPVPSESLDSGTYCKDMWRGPTWLNLSYLLYLGLQRYGFDEDAARLRETLLSEVQRWYEREGCLWEYYDSLALTSPRQLDRKQRLVTGKGFAPISDYHWTAAMVAALG